MIQHEEKGKSNHSILKEEISDYRCAYSYRM